MSVTYINPKVKDELYNEASNLNISASEFITRMWLKHKSESTTTPDPIIDLENAMSVASSKLKAVAELVESLDETL